MKNKKDVTDLNTLKIEKFKKVIEDCIKMMANGFIEEFEFIMNDKEEPLKSERFKKSIENCTKVVANGLIKEFESIMNDKEGSSLSLTEIGNILKDPTE
jgi:hypothetical protein